MPITRTREITRADGIEMGLLVDVTKTARKHGFQVASVALSQAAYLDCVAWTAADSRRKRVQEDTVGRLAEVLDVALLAAAARGDEVRKFPVYRVPREGWSWLAKYVQLVLLIGLDDGKPVITILLADEF